MKKFVVIMLLLIMALTMFTACGQKEEPAETETVVSGMLSLMGASEEDVNQSLLDFGLENIEVKFFDDLNSMVLALQGDKIISIGRVPDSTAKYIESVYPDLKALARFDGKESALLSYYMGFNSAKKDVADKVQVALEEMKTDGTIDKLVVDYIDAFVDGGEPSAVDMPVIDGAETIKVVVTGDLPPFDYVSADGKPCGFNTAVLAEISKRIGMNIELVCTNSAGRAAALSSGKADAVFSVSGGIDGDTEYSSDCPEDIISVGPYYETEHYMIVKAKEQ